MRRDARERAIWVWAGSRSLRYGYPGQRYWPTEEEKTRFVETGEHSKDYLIFSRTQARQMCRPFRQYDPNDLFRYRVWRTLKEALKEEAE